MRVKSGRAFGSFQGRVTSAMNCLLAWDSVSISEGKHANLYCSA